MVNLSILSSKNDFAFNPQGKATSSGLRFEEGEIFPAIIKSLLYKEFSHSPLFSKSARFYYPYKIYDFL